jgi:hypothetical protein
LLPEQRDKGLYWEGISQGAIMGGALTALEPDLTHSVLNVTGMNYSTLLWVGRSPSRSVTSIIGSGARLRSRRARSSRCAIRSMRL